jgi:hypothetical protein
MNQQREQLPGEFRLIRNFSVDHNARRLRAYVKRLTKAPKHRELVALMRMKRRAKRGGAIQ